MEEHIFKRMARERNITEIYLLFQLRHCLLKSLTFLSIIVILRKDRLIKYIKYTFGTSFAYHLCGRIAI